MFLAYNVILHFPVVFVNSFIIIKEFSLEFWQFLWGEDDDGNEMNDMALGFWDLVNVMDEGLWFIDPRTWINYALNMFIEWGIQALIEGATHDAFTKQ